MKVFISYASEDRTRFVEEFATKLLEDGLDVWYDEWELKLGDSLIDIFDAISQCDVFISVISEYSIESRWVKEECDSAFIRKIEEKMRFIPIVLPGNFEIPYNIKHLLQCRIDNLNDYEGEFNKILSSIYDISIKPKIRNGPKYTLITPIEGLKKSDTIVIKVMGDFFQKTNIYTLSFEKVAELTKDFDLSERDIYDSLELLKDMEYINYVSTFDSEPVDIEFTYNGCILYCKYYIDDFRGLLNKIFLSIINENLEESNQIVQETNIQEFIVNAVLECLESNGYIEIIKTFSGILIVKISVKGKRYIEGFVDETYEFKKEKLEKILPECNEKETIIFKDLCNYFLNRRFDDEIDPMTIINIVDKYYDENDFNKLQERIAYSLKNLEENNYIITVGGLMGMAFSSISISDKGFCFYLKEFYKNPTAYLTVIEELNSSNNFIISDFSKKYEIHYSIIEYLIKIFRKKNFISCGNDLTNIIVTAQGKEYFESKLSKNIF